MTRDQFYNKMLMIIDADAGCTTVRSYAQVAAQIYEAETRCRMCRTLSPADPACEACNGTGSRLR